MQYRGEVFDDGDKFIFIRGGASVVVIEIDNGTLSAEVTIDTNKARELARHLISAIIEADR